MQNVEKGLRRYSVEELRKADEELSRVARGGNARLLALGEALGVMEESRAYSKLGFSSFAAYVGQRVERPVAWAEDLLRLARRLESLPLLRKAMATGRTTMSHAQLVARHIGPAEDAVWSELAATLTIRQLRRAIAEKKKADVAAGAEPSSGGPPAPEPLDEDEERRSIARRVTYAQKVLFEAALMRLDAVAGYQLPPDEAIEAALAEAEVTMMRYGTLPIVTSKLDAVAEAVITREETLRERMAAEERAEPGLPAREPVDGAPPGAPPAGPVELDRFVHATAGALLHADVEIGRLAEIVLADRNWKRLGYGSPHQLAKERTGFSLEKLRDARRLAFKARAHPALGRAVAERRVGKASAVMIAGVAKTAAAASAWVARAEKRTVKDLREEVRAARVLETEKPPTDAQYQSVVALQRAVVGYVDPSATRQMSVDTDLARGGSSELRFRLEETLFERFLEVEAMYRAFEQPDGEFVEFIAKAIFDSYPPEPSQIEYADVYARDRYTCLTPFCVSRRVTPHHIQRRSQGGSEQRTNLASECLCCHLDLIHVQNVIAMQGAAPDNILWEIGPPEARWVIRGRDVIKRPPS